MSGRGASASVLTELGKTTNKPLHLIELRFDAADGGTFYLCDAYRPIVWNGNTYTCAGHFLSFSGLTESADLRVAQLKAQLAGVDQTLIAMVLARQYIDRRLLIYKGFLDQASDAVIVDPVAIHDGRMDAPQIDEDPTNGLCSVTVTSSDEFADFDRLTGRHTNPNDQNIWFPNDRGFDNIASIAGKQVTLVWGRPRP